jgi:hypothetical protein
MRPRFKGTGLAIALLAVLVWCRAPAARAADAGDEPGFTSLFNGMDLSGWRFGKEPLDGKTATVDGRFKVEKGVILVTGQRRPDEPRMEEIDTAAPLDRDFILRFDFRASPNANSGLHLRDHALPHQLQIRDYPRAGPYKSLKHYKDGDWNSIEVTVKARPGGKDAVARCTCNGEVLEESLVIPAKGPIGLQSETNTLEYRNLRVKVTN